MRAPEFWSEPGQGALLSGLLAPLGAAYDLAGRLRRAAVSPAQAGVPVICVGNLVTGGAGKTPVVLSLAKRLTEQDIAVHLLTRGYGGQASGPLRVDPLEHDANEVGDEALLLARAAPTWVARDRPAAARMAVAGGARALILDDGFQNPALAKDLSLLVVDGDYGFGNGRVMPAGPLRERPAGGLARADALVLMGADRHGLAEAWDSRLPVLRARLEPTAEAKRFDGKRVFAFAGIGRPQKFFQGLADVGTLVAGTRSFADHHRYGARELAALHEAAEELDAALVTTEKDAQRLPKAERARIECFPVELAWQDGAALDALIAPLFDNA